MPRLPRGPILTDGAVRDRGRTSGEQSTRGNSFILVRAVHHFQIAVGIHSTPNRFEELELGKGHHLLPLYWSILMNQGDPAEILKKGFLLLDA